MNNTKIIAVLRKAVSMYEEAGMNLGYTPAGEKLLADMNELITELEAGAAAPAVPDAMDIGLGASYEDAAYVSGWNDCRDAMLPAAPQPAAPAVPYGWQQIKTAPKDGSWILAVVEGYIPLIVHWNDEYGKWVQEVRVDCTDEVWEEITDLGYNPTHWMPFPAAPQPAEKKWE